MIKLNCILVSSYPIVEMPILDDQNRNQEIQNQSYSSFYLWYNEIVAFRRRIRISFLGFYRRVLKRHIIINITIDSVMLGRSMRSRIRIRENWMVANSLIEIAFLEEIWFVGFGGGWESFGAWRMNKIVWIKITNQLKVKIRYYPSMSFINPKVW